jgi:hypothetical protein
LDSERVQSCTGPQDYAKSPQNLIELTRGTRILTLSLNSHQLLWKGAYLKTRTTERPLCRQQRPYNELAPLDSRGWRRKTAATEHADIKTAIAIMFTGSKKFSAAIAIASLLCLRREVICPF